ncbi:aminoglycoside phosphotransferase family protein [soil metagenome]
MNLPTDLVQKLYDVHEDAAPWLAELDGLIVGLETRWHIRVTGLVEELSYNVVAFAEGEEGAPYVLKLSPPSEDFSREILALRLYDGDGICRLVEANEEVGAMLLERLQPGVSLWNTDDDEGATRTAAELMQRLWRPVTEPNSFRSLRSWARELYAYPQQTVGILPHAFVDKAVEVFDELLQDPQPPVLLHADLHHGNILSADRAPFLAIDPKGIVGPRGYDVANFLRNPLGLEQRPDLRRILDARVNIFSEMLGMSPEEVAAWGFAHGVLSAVWSLSATDANISGSLIILGELERLL